MRNKKNRETSQPVGFWEMFRDVLIASLNKGQFIPALIGLSYILMIVKMPSEDVSRLMFEIVDKIEKGYLVGYAFGIISLCSWFIHSKWQRRKIVLEMKRLGEEKSGLQKNQLGNIVKSSQK
jgi:hypothetical protein